MEWQIGAYHTNSDNDIVNLASVIQGRGYFQNVPQTRRQGVDASVQFRSSQWFAYANYNYIDATYQFTGDLASPNNPSADDNGAVHVVPGDHIPGIPKQQFKIGADYACTRRLPLAAMSRSGNANTTLATTPTRTKVAVLYGGELHATYAFSSKVGLFGIINNLFDRKYALYGTYFDPDDVANAIPQQLTDVRTQTPAQGINFRVALRVRF